MTRANGRRSSCRRTVVTSIVWVVLVIATTVPVIGIVAGKPVVAVEQQRRGLVFVDGICSGVLLSEDWVLTAGHCVPSQRPNPAVTVTAIWAPGVTANSDAIYQFADGSAATNPGPEVALVHLTAPFPGITPGYRLQLYPGALQSLRGKTIAKYGQGHSSYGERNSTTGRVAPEGAGVYRAADLQVHQVDGYTITYLPSEAGQLLQPGDSGGPGVVWENGLALLAGISSASSWKCFNAAGATPAARDAACRQSIFQQVRSYDIAIPAIKGAMEAVLKTRWNAAATSVPVWVLRPEMEVTGGAFPDANAVHWAQAARAAAKLCYNRGFIGGHFDGHQDVANGGYGIHCSGQGATWRDATAAEIAATPWPIAHIDQANWAQANRAAERLCAATNQGFAGGHLNGHMLDRRYGLFCYKDNAQWFDATGQELAATRWLDANAKLDDVPWAHAARAAVDFCRTKGFSGGFMNGHQVPGKFGVVCQK